MSRTKEIVLFSAVIAAAILGAFGSAFASGGEIKEPHEGGFITPCSLDGVNPAYHPKIFGNPAVARQYGFVQARNGTWEVMPSCHR